MADPIREAIDTLSSALRDVDAGQQDVAAAIDAAKRRVAQAIEGVDDSIAGRCESAMEESLSNTATSNASAWSATRDAIKDEISKLEDLL